MRCEYNSSTVCLCLNDVFHCFLHRVIYPRAEHHQPLLHPGPDTRALPGNKGKYLMNVEQKYFNRRTDSDSAAVTTTRENDFTPYYVSIMLIISG